MLNDFHFIRPLWLLALVALIFALYLLKKYRVKQSGWQQLLPSHLANVLIDTKKANKPLSLTIPFIIGFLAILALAGPTWKKLPQPVYQVARGSILIMDMSYSMYATDLSPNRLTRARFKAIDLLDRLNEGEIGLVAYAGDAFVISPLTEDINNIKLLLPSLSPDLMPELGSNPYSALALAHEMLTNAGHLEGDIYWFTDGIDSNDLQDITNWSREHPHRLNILGVGTQTGAPIKLTNGELMKDDNGAIVIPKLSTSLLKGAASRGRGHYTSLTTNDADIETLLTQPLDIEQDKQSDNMNSGDQWQEFGPYLLIIILPLVLGYFRRGSLVVMLPFMLMFSMPKPAQANIWQDLWKTKDQQGQQLFNQERYQDAASQFNDPMWQASAHYKAENYQQALEAYQQVDGAESLYNQGNTLAKMQQFDEAIDAYEKALALDPDHQDAKANKELLEKLKQQQEQQQNQNSDSQENQQNDQNQQNSEQQQNADQNQSNDNQQQDNQQQSDAENQQNQEQQQSDQQNAEQNKSEAEKQQEQEQQQKKQQEQENKEEGQQKEQQAQLSEQQLDKETEQKHKQLLNKVTDDPYLLLRNKMQLEYQKRRQNRSQLGVKKKW